MVIQWSASITQFLPLPYGHTVRCQHNTGSSDHSGASSPSPAVWVAACCIPYRGHGSTVGSRTLYHYSHVTWASWHLKSPATPLFIQQFVLANTKATSKLHITCLCERNPSATSGFASQSVSNVKSVSMSWLLPD